MTSRVKLLNRQKKLSLDTEHWGGALESLALAVFADVRQKRPRHLRAADIKLVESRGVVSVELVSNEKIRKLNQQWRGKAYATDVLSFPLIFDGSGASYLPELHGVDEVELGEVVISVEKACEQAAEYGHSFERELAFLFVHGLLHILGFDHETTEEEKDMFSRQKAVLNCVGYVK